MDYEDPTFDEIEKFLEQTRTKGAKILSVLGKISPEVNVLFNTEVGREILKEDIYRIEELMEKIANFQSTPEDLAELRYLNKVRMPKVLGKLKKYIDGVKLIKNVAKAR